MYVWETFLSSKFLVSEYYKYIIAYLFDVLEVSYSITNVVYVNI